MWLVAKLCIIATFSHNKERDVLNYLPLIALGRRCKNHRPIIFNYLGMPYKLPWGGCGSSLRWQSVRLNINNTTYFNHPIFYRFTPMVSSVLWQYYSPGYVRRPLPAAQYALVLSPGPVLLQYMQVLRRRGNSAWTPTETRPPSFYTACLVYLVSPLSLPAHPGLAAR